MNINIVPLFQKFAKSWQLIRLAGIHRAKNIRRTSTRCLDMIAIENSANCNLRCEACPTVYAKDYPGEFMTLETLKRICENITPEIVPKCGLLGWGEPFFDPGYFEKLRHLKKNKYYVGSTSNFCLFTEEMAKNIIDSGLDHLNISLDANHLNASGMTLTKMIAKIDLLFRLCETRANSLVVGVIIVAFKSSYDLTYKILRLLKDYPFIYTDIIPLWYLPSKDLYAESMSQKEFISLKEKISEDFKDLHVNFDFTLRDDKIDGNCRADILKTAFITYKGEVSPCATLAIEFPNVTYDGELGWTRPLSFGRLDQMAFKQIWKSDNYRFFRSQFRQNKLPKQCRYCNMWKRLA